MTGTFFLLRRGELEAIIVDIYAIPLLGLIWPRSPSRRLTAENAAQLFSPSLGGWLADRGQLADTAPVVAVDSG